MNAILEASGLLLVTSLLVHSSGRCAESNAAEEELIQCSSFVATVRPKVIVRRDLKADLCKYYDAENGSDWQATYAMRPTVFRSVIGKDVYVREMTEAKQSYVIVEMTVRSADVANGRTVLGIDYLEATSKNASRRVVTRGESTEWIEEADGWKCASCGSRIRYNLNWKMAE